MLTILYKKTKRKFWLKIVKFSRINTYYPCIYKSYWKVKFNLNSKRTNVPQYMTSIPNAGAGIGHQLANWIAGYWFAKQFNLKFAHSSFSNKKWEVFLGFGENETKVVDLMQSKNYKKVRLPLFDEENSKEIEFIEKIITAYRGQKVVFVCEQDQFYFDQFGVIEAIKQKFNQAITRKSDKYSYDDNNFNIAIHVRRTVIIDSKVILEDEVVRAKRWLSNDYYEKVLLKVVENLKQPKPIKIHIFSTANADEFLEFSKYGEVMFCNDFNEYVSFLHLVKADLLITSKSSFSYKPALMSDGIKVCPRNFWHGYPNDNRWILAENDGDFNVDKLKDLI